jgi:hypothetical protein
LTYIYGKALAFERLADERRRLLFIFHDEDSHDRVFTENQGGDEQNPRPYFDKPMTSDLPLK